MNHLDDEGNPKRASLPDTLAPDELTVEVGHDLIENHSGGPRALGVDPVSGGTVEVRNGRFGPYVALVMPSADAGDAAGGASEKPKRGKGAKKAAADRPKMASLFKTMSPESLTLDDALRLLSLPREVGSYEEVDAQTGEVQTVTVQANNGRYGPYLTKPVPMASRIRVRLLRKMRFSRLMWIRRRNCSPSRSMAVGVAVVLRSRRCANWASIRKRRSR